ASLFSDRPVKPRLAMTGEVTLSGKVLPIGGVKEKVLAARRAGIKEIILPERNRKDYLEDIPEEVRGEMKFHFVEEVSRVLGLALQSSERPNGARANGKGAAASSARRLGPRRLNRQPQRASKQK